MKISFNWLKEYVLFYLSPQELADKLTHVGLVVADIKAVEDDYCLEVEVTSNRPDCLGMIGIAREVAAAVGGNLRIPETLIQDKGADVAGNVRVDVEDAILCPRYTARILNRVNVGPSPEWMQKRLQCIGLRPINNVVDITNYVMMETGQPLHAFDLDKLCGQKIVVRKARAGEEIVAINGARRVLFHDMLVIADGEKPVAIAGVMGGKETEVSWSTRNVLLECAQFDPQQVRRTSKALGIASDSSYRFERGVDPEGVEYASKRAASLIQAHAGGETAGKCLEVRSQKPESGKVTLRLERLRKALGMEIKRDVAVDILTRLQFTILNVVDTFIDVGVPSFRGDVYREIDLIEEVSRIYGYNNIPTKTAIGVRGSVKSEQEIVEDLIRQTLVGLGFFEVKTFSIVDASPAQSVNLWSDSAGIEIANPLRLEESRLRTCLLPGLINAKRHNANHGTEQVRFFEIAKVYLAGKEKLPVEKTCLSLLADVDFLTLKGVVESLLMNLGVLEGCEWTAYGEPRFFNDDRAAKALMNGATLGYLGGACKELELKTSPCLAELDVDLLAEVRKKSVTGRKYRSLPQHPSVSRDLAIIVDEEVAWASIEKCINDIRVPFLRAINFFDVYRGKQVPPGKKSIAFNLCFQSPDRTLTSEEVDAAQQGVLGALNKSLGAELRTL